MNSGSDPVWTRPERNRGICLDSSVLNESNSIRSSSVGWTYIISNEQAGDEQRGGMSVATETANNRLDNTVIVTKLACVRLRAVTQTGWRSQSANILNWLACGVSVKDSLHVRAVGYSRNASAPSGLRDAMNTGLWQTEKCHVRVADRLEAYGSAGDGGFSGYCSRTGQCELCMCVSPNRGRSQCITKHLGSMILGLAWVVISTNQTGINTTKWGKDETPK